MLTARIEGLNAKMGLAPEHSHTSLGPSVHQLRSQQAELKSHAAHVVNMAANELSRAMASNALRLTALTAMRLDDCLELYTPQVLHQIGWHSLPARETVNGTGQRASVTRRVAVYKTIQGAPDTPTRYRPLPGTQTSARLLNLYDR